MLTHNFAQNTSDLQGATNASKIIWKFVEYDFGEIKQGSPVLATFEFKNSSNEPVLISNVRSSCGCTVADYSKKPILPGESSTISITYNAQKGGAFNKTITVFLNETDQHKLTIKGIVMIKE
ncbi:MAG: DUF1573 domain-containing protein [Bacteroidetes bacterium]|nr:DUF1573 domain-containing protein [Bacteroidota bacterium]